MSANLLDHPVTHALGWTLVHFLWQGAAVTALLAGVLSLMRRQTAQARYLAACAGLALMAASPAITLAVLRQQPARSLDRGTVVLITEVPSEVGLPAPLRADELSRSAWGRAISALSTRSMDTLLPGMVAAWLAGVFFLSLRLLGGWSVVQRLTWRGTRPIGGELSVRAAELARCLGIRRPVLLLESAAVQVPTVIGWLRAVILLPAGALSGLPPRQLEAILAHELAHIRRYDYLVNLAQAVVETVLFYHPCVWWISRRIRVEREHCCDDLAVEALGDRVAYARALASLAELRGAPLAPALAASGGNLLARIRRVLGQPSEQADPISLWMGGTAAVLLLFGTIAVMRVSATDAGNRLANALVQRANVALLRITPARAVPVTGDHTLALASVPALRTDAGPWPARKPGRTGGSAAVERQMIRSEPRHSIAAFLQEPVAPAARPYPDCAGEPTAPAIPPGPRLAGPRAPTASPSPAARPSPAASPSPTASPSAGVVLVSDRIPEDVLDVRREPASPALGEGGPAGSEWAQLARERVEGVSAELPPCPARRGKRPARTNAWSVITASLEVGQMEMGALIVPAANLKGANLSGKHLSAAHLASADLADARLARTDLSHADLTGANLSDAHLANANLAKANLSGANLRDADLSHADLSGANLSGADLTGARLEGARLIGTALQGAHLRETHLEGVDLARADLRGADLVDVDLTAVHLAGASLVGVNLADAHLAGADLTGANLTGANLGDADLSRTRLARANLFGANLTDANLSRALLEGANLYGATLNGADLSGVDLSRVDLSGANGVGS